MQSLVDLPLSDAITKVGSTESDEVIDKFKFGWTELIVTVKYVFRVDQSDGSGESFVFMTGNSPEDSAHIQKRDLPFPVNNDCNSPCLIYHDMVPLRIRMHEVGILFPIERLIACHNLPDPRIHQDGFLLIFRVSSSITDGAKDPIAYVFPFLCGGIERTWVVRRG